MSDVSTSNRGRRASNTLRAGVVVLVLMGVLAVIAPLVWSGQAASLTPIVRGAASSDHPLGTDALGRDSLFRTLVATRLTLLMAAAATLLAVAGGIALGGTIVLAGTRVRAIGERFIDLMVAYPPIIVALAVTAIFRPSAASVIIAIGLAFSPQFARLTNTLAASISRRDFVAVAQLLGVRPMRVFRTHILPNIAGPLLVLASVGFATAIITLSGLSFIGLGVQEPAYDWGRLLSQGLQDLNVNPIEVLGPALAIVLTGLAAGLVGDGLDQYLDPRQRSTGPAQTESSGERGWWLWKRRRPVGGAPAAVSGAASLEARPPSPADDVVLSVEDLQIAAGGTDLVRGVSLNVRRGEVVGIVGESGSGKSLTAMAAARLLAPGLRWSASRLQVAGRDLSNPQEPPPRELATDIGIVFQDPSSCFNPSLHLGTQLTEVARVHQGMSKREATRVAVERLREVQLSRPERRVHQYPHQLSGGMRQRAMIAMALLTSPPLLIADEPTTALDVTVQAGVLRLLRRINKARGMAIVLISHDIKVVSALCDRVCVMYAGRLVEELSAEDLNRRRVAHPYTRALLDAAPELGPAMRRKRLVPLRGRPPEPGKAIAGCAFAPRCFMAEERCLEVVPELRPIEGVGMAACHVTEGPLGQTRESA